MYILQNYDDSLRKILKEGKRKQNRTGIDTLAIFGLQNRYRIDERFPLLTGRKIFPKAIFAELLWFLSGSSNNKDLQALNSNIWTPWVDKDFEEKNGFVEGSLGPIYGFQLRHFGGKYGDGDKNNPDYGQDGFDQLEYVINEIKTNPESRRIMFSLWNPKDLKVSRLAPCHFHYMIYIEDDRISANLTQRSCDFAVGVPANIQFYSALTYMLGQQTGYKPFEFIHTTLDSHIYVNQVDAIEEYLSRDKPDSPTLNLKKAKDIYSYLPEDFEVLDYNPNASIKIPVAV